MPWTQLSNAALMILIMLMAAVAIVKLTGFEAFVLQLLNKDVISALESSKNIKWLRHHLNSVAAACLASAVLYVLIMYVDGWQDLSFLQLQSCPNQ